MTKTTLPWVAVISLYACAPETPATVLSSPTEALFLHASSARVVAFAEGTNCREALAQLETGDGELLADSGLVEPCDFWEAGAFTFEGAPAEQGGLRPFTETVPREAVFVATLLERDGVTVMATGCRAGRAAEEEVVIELAPTTYYNETYGPTPPRCESAEARCASDDRDPACE